MIEVGSTQKIKESDGRHGTGGLGKISWITLEQCKSVLKGVEKGGIAPFSIGSVTIGKKEAEAILNNDLKKIKKFPGLLETIQ